MSGQRISLDLQEAVATIRDVAAGERLRRGRFAGVLAAVTEWLSLGLALVSARFGRGARITGGTPQPPEPGRPGPPAKPSRSVNPAMVTVPSVTLKTRCALPPLMARIFAPGPST